MIPFERSEFEQRLARTRARMDSLGIDVLVVTDESNMYYLTGYAGRSDYVPQCVVVNGDGEPEIVLRMQDMACARHTVWMDHSHIHELPERFIGYPDRSGWAHIGRMFEAWGYTRTTIALERDSLEQRRNLELALPNARFVDADLLVNRVRDFKSQRELQYMRIAGRIADHAMQAAIDAIGSGVRQCDVAAALVSAQVGGLPDAGGELTDVFMPFGSWTDSPHLSWTDEVIAPGTAVNIEMGGSYRRYVAPMSRSIHVGRPPDRLKALHAATLEGMEAVFAFVKPGVTCEEVEARFRATTSRYGFIKDSRIGYVIGIDWAGGTASLHPGDRTELQPNMTFHLMLGMWQPGDWGLTLSEGFSVTETGCESFVSLSRELFVKN